MSIVYEKNNCVLISHAEFINKMYSGLNCALNSGLFEINQEFKKPNPKKAKQADDEKFADLIQNIAYIKQKYMEFAEDINKVRASNKINADGIKFKQENANSNGNALKLAQKIQENFSEDEKPRFSGGNTDDTAIQVDINGVNHLIPARCRFYCHDVAVINQQLSSEKKFDVILLDPPWWNKAVRRKRKRGYNMLENTEISNIPIEQLLADDGVVVIWCTNSPQCLTALMDDCLTKWGVKFAAKWFWLKVTKDFTPILPFSIPPLKQPFEQIILAGRNDAVCAKLAQHDGKVLVSLPSALHSHKPPLDALIKRILGEDLSCLEVFARYLLADWCSYGLEVLGLQNVNVYTSTL